MAHADRKFNGRMYREEPDHRSYNGMSFWFASRVKRDRLWRLMKYQSPLTLDYMSKVERTFIVVSKRLRYGIYFRMVEID